MEPGLKIQCRNCETMVEFEIGLVVCPKCGNRFSAEQIMGMGVGVIEGITPGEGMSSPVPETVEKTEPEPGGGEFSGGGASGDFTPVKE